MEMTYLDFLSEKNTVRTSAVMSDDDVGLDVIRFRTDVLQTNSDLGRGVLRCQADILGTVMWGLESTDFEQTY